MSSCRLWKMDRFIYLDLLLRDAKAQRQRLVDFVKEQKVFSGLTAEQAAGVAELLQPVVLPAAAEYAGTQWSALAGSGTEAAAGATSAATADAIFFVERGELTLHRDGDSDATTLKRGDAFGAAETHLAALLSRLGHTTNAELHLAEPSSSVPSRWRRPRSRPRGSSRAAPLSCSSCSAPPRCARRVSWRRGRGRGRSGGRGGCDGGCAPVAALSSLSPDEFAAAQAALSPARFVTGDVLCRAGEPSPAVYLLVAGSCTMAAHTLHVGSWFGEGGALFHKPSSAAIVAAEPVVFCRPAARSSSSFPRRSSRLCATRTRRTERRGGGGGESCGGGGGVAQAVALTSAGRDAAEGGARARPWRVRRRDARHLRLGPDSGKRFALKVVDRHKVEAEEQQAHILAEKEAMLALSHPYVLRLHRTFKDYHSLYFLLEYAPGGELQHLLDKQGGKLTEKAPHAPRAAARAVPPRPTPPALPAPSNSRPSLSGDALHAASLVLALDHMHTHHIVHRDLKPANMLLDARGFLKVIDFGLCKQLPPRERAYTCCGTPEYLSPEALSHEGHSYAADWWSLGCILYELVVGITPFMDGGKVKTCKALYTNITSSERRYKVVYPSTLSRDGADLISKLLIKAQSKRMRSFGLLRSPFLGPFIRGHPFFGEVNWENMEAGAVQTPHLPDFADGPDTTPQGYTAISLKYSVPNALRGAEVATWDGGFS